jgi:hypothetical protein
MVEADMPMAMALKAVESFMVLMREMEQCALGMIV